MKFGRHPTEVAASSLSLLHPKPASCNKEAVSHLILAMLTLPCRKFLRNLLPSYLHHLQAPISRSLSTQISDSTAEHPPSITISYLINSCGLSPQAALSASLKIRLKTTQQADSVLRFLKTQGFDPTQIANIIASNPQFLHSKAESSFQPKIQFLRSIGLSDTRLTELITLNPQILRRGLDSQLIPSVDFLRTLLETNENVLKALKRSGWLLNSRLDKVMRPNVDLLREEYGMPLSLIVQSVMREPGVMMKNTDTLREVASRVQELGFERGSFRFMVAVEVLSRMSKLKWSAKIETLKSLGWLEEDIFFAFRKFPFYMYCSDTKLTTMMDFYTKKMRRDLSFISHHPQILMFSLRKRVIPRSRVCGILISKELIKEDELIQMLNLNDQGFLKKYVKKFEKEIPYLMKAYEGKLNFEWLDASNDGGKLD